MHARAYCAEGAVCSRTLAGRSLGRARHLACPPPRSSCRARHRHAPAAAFHIDRRHHLNLAFERQSAEEQLLARAEADVAGSALVTVRSLRHLDRLLEAAGGCVVVLALHSRSCGICKDVLQELAQLCRESHSQRAGVVFLQHDVLDEYDFPSQLARYYGIRSVPTVLYFVDGAVVRTGKGLPDVRQVSRSGAQLRTALDSERRSVASTLRALLFKNAPSARR